MIYLDIIRKNSEKVKTMATILKNYTPHACHIYDNAGKEIIGTYESEGNARVTTKNIQVGTVGPDNAPLFKSEYGEIDGLPEPEENVLYIVSFIVKNACPERNDLISPASDPQNSVRDEAGRILGTKGFAL